MRSLGVIGGLGLLAWLVVRAPGPQPETGDLPGASFQPNVGQTAAEVKFLARARDYTLYLTGEGAVLSAGGEAVLRMEVAGADPDAEVAGRDRLAGRSHYLLGNDPSRWISEVPHYREVAYRQVYSGIDLIYHAARGRLEYDFVVSPGADPARIRLRFPGARRVGIDGRQDLVVETGAGGFRQRRPVARQGSRPVRAAYRVERDGSVAFELGPYDPAQELLIDPVLAYSTYLRGNADDEGTAVAVDAAGNAYAIGTTASAEFPTAGTVPSGRGAGKDVYVAKFNPSGSELVWATYLGGGADDFGDDIAVDGAGNVFICGGTLSANFPTAGTPLQRLHGGAVDGFLARLGPSGSSLTFATFWGGNQADRLFSLALDSGNNIYAAGNSGSPNYATLNALQRAYGGGQVDAVVLKMDGLGGRLFYSTYLGGRESDQANGIAVDGDGAAYVTGFTTSPNFPLAVALQSANGGTLDAFVTKIRPDGAGLVYSTYLGGRSSDVASGIAVDGSGNAIVTGNTASTNFPLSRPLRPALAGTDAFVTKIRAEATGLAMVFSTYLGSPGYDAGRDVAVDGSGNIYVTGDTDSAEFPERDPLQSLPGPNNFVFVSRLRPDGSALDFSTRLGATAVAGGLAVDPDRSIYLTGWVRLPGTFPLTAGAYDTNQRGRGGSEAFVLKISDATAATSVSAASFAPGALAPAAIAATFGQGLAAGVEVATRLPLPTTLGDATVRVIDSAGVERLAPLFYASPGQINHLIPAGTATGTARVLIAVRGRLAGAGSIQVDRAAPALFTANATGRGPAAALYTRVTAGGAVTTELASQCAAAGCTGNPIDLGEEGDQVVLVLFGTGIRGRTSLAAARLTVGGVSVPVAYAGEQPDFVGLDQVNTAALPRSLRGRGLVDVVLTVDGKAANTVTVVIR